MSSDQTAIRELVTRWHQATAGGEVETILGLMSKDALFFVAGKEPMKGRQTFASGLRSLLQSHRIESTGDVQEVEVSGDLAYCWTRLEVRVTPLAGDSTHTRSGSTLSIFRRERDGEWRLIRDANLLTPL